ncbi:hypothetical protein C8R44DRAFT_750993 [Mycena epipterygia]|nr:hypothetical protein C8R44DRAFT_750993 [Mycena epipterygia]
MTVLESKRERTKRRVKDYLGMAHTTWFSAGKVRFGSGSGPFALNAEPERGVRFGQLPNLEPERAFSALVVGKGISHAFASADTPTNDKLSSRKFARKLSDNKPSSINIEIALNLPRREGLGSAFERTCSPPNAEPNFRFRFKYSLNLNAERVILTRHAQDDDDRAHNLYLTALEGFTGHNYWWSSEPRTADVAE